MDMDIITGILSPLSPKPQTISEDIPTVKLGVIGTSTAGKSYLVAAINYLVLNSDIKLNNNMWLDVIGGVETAKRLGNLKGAFEVMKTGVLPSTLAPKDFTFRLLHLIKPICTMIYNDNVGQVLTDVADPKKNTQRNEFIKTITTSDVVWLFIPMQVNQAGECSGIKMEDVVITRAYLLDALQNRSDKSPLALAIVLTKVDVLGDIELDSSKKVLHSIAQSIKDQLSPIINSPMISIAALFPISVLGFNNAKLISEDIDSGSLNFSLVSDTVKPYNIDKLLVWSLGCFMYQNAKVQIDANIKQGIQQNIQDREGLIYLLKSGN